MARPSPAPGRRASSSPASGAAPRPIDLEERPEAQRLRHGATSSWTLGWPAPMPLYDALAESPAQRSRATRSRAAAGPSRPSSSVPRRSCTCRAPARRGSARTSSTTPTSSARSSRPGRCSRWPASGRSTASRAIWPSSICSAAPRSGSPPFRPTGAGRSSPPRPTSRCARPGARWPTCSGREPRPIAFVVSLRLGDPPSLEPVTRRLAAYPDLRFKLDATPDWDDDADRRASRTPARWPRSTSRAPTRARRSTRRPIPASTAAARRPSPRPGWRTPT